LALAQAKEVAGSNFVEVAILSPDLALKPTASLISSSLVSLPTCTKVQPESAVEFGAMAHSAQGLSQVGNILVVVARKFKGSAMRMQQPKICGKSQ